MSRPSRHQTFMEVAEIMAKRSTCMRLNVGAVVVQDRKIVGVGYNGAPRHEPHCSEALCAGDKPCTRTIHAEMNALIHIVPGLRMNRHGPVVLDMYVTHSPCATCYQNLINRRQIRHLFIRHEYRSTSHLIREKLPIYFVTPSGYVVDFWSKQRVEVES